ncbi:PP2C family protein-serine/threonine phosphatase [Streptomyces sp. WMMC500]|uniref:PP2C family protein-serine/threonine phosphatase n=1 Tax=Streptomyces sp. WMMC500 TaxID=3015154 RepID=UPI00248B1A0C|nr:PP2C family protein-serine/threonine phosphatase [Streptomyces sp. WMMC500]WBB61767.1 PP2C family protein-serine/threonine phosphatase [Streptomyces sp. WMMC500]
MHRILTRIPQQLRNSASALLLLVAVLVADWLHPPNIAFGSALVVVPVLAAVNASWRAILVCGALALAGGIAIGVWDYDVSAEAKTSWCLAIIGATVLGLAEQCVRVRRERQLDQVRQVAHAAQTAVLHPPPPVIGQVLIAASYDAAANEAEIGGDLYEVINTPWGVRAIIGDVRGKGLRAVRESATVLGIFREAAYDEPDLARVAARIDHMLTRDIGAEDFVTVLLLCLRPDGRCTVLNYGHPPPLHRTGKGDVTEVECPARLPLGIGIAAAADKTQTDLRLAPDDELLLVTDGVLEARDATGAFYPFRKRYASLPHTTPANALAALRRDLMAYCGNRLHDDTAMLLLRYAALA